MAEDDLGTSPYSCSSKDPGTFLSMIRWPYAIRWISACCSVS